MQIFSCLSSKSSPGISLSFGEECYQGSEINVFPFFLKLQIACGVCSLHIIGGKYSDSRSGRDQGEYARPAPARPHTVHGHAGLPLVFPTVYGRTMWWGGKWPHLCSGTHKVSQENRYPSYQGVQYSAK